MVEDGKTQTAADRKNNQILWAIPHSTDFFFRATQKQINLNNAQKIEVQRSSPHGFPLSINVVAANRQVFHWEILQFAEIHSVLKPTGKPEPNQIAKAGSIQSPLEVQEHPQLQLSTQAAWSKST